MGIATQVYSPSQWQFAIKAETTTGTANTTAMLLLNVDGDVSVTQEIVQTLDVRSGGSGRTLKAADVHTTDLGSQLTTISVPIVMDGAIDATILANVLGTAVGTSPASFDLAYNYAPDGRETGATSGDETHSLTFAIVSPQADESRIFTGGGFSTVNVVMSSDNDGGRRHATLTYTTRFRPADGAAAPSGLVAYNSTFRYLREFNTTKTVGGVDVILNKVEYTIENPYTYTGYQGANGDPEIIHRGINEAKVTMVIGVKYDANTANFWEKRRAGTIIAVELSDNATWASATFGIKASYCKITDNVNPVGTDAGVFQDLQLQATGSTSGDIIQIVP